MQALDEVEQLWPATGADHSPTADAQRLPQAWNVFHALSLEHVNSPLVSVIVMRRFAHGKLLDGKVMGAFTERNKIALVEEEAGMTKDDIQLLFQYDRWANSRVIRAASMLNDEQLTRNLGGAFPSVRDTLAHLIGGEWIWLVYWKEPPRSAEALAMLKQQQQKMFDAERFVDIGSLKKEWEKIEQEQKLFVSRLTNESLAQMMPFREKELSLAHLMQHLVNHSTYHRGQVALMMRQLGADPLATDFHLFLLETVFGMGATTVL